MKKSQRELLGGLVKSHYRSQYKVLGFPQEPETVTKRISRNTELSLKKNIILEDLPANILSEEEAAYFVYLHNRIVSGNATKEEKEKYDGLSQKMPKLSGSVVEQTRSSLDGLLKTGTEN